MTFDQYNDKLIKDESTYICFDTRFNNMSVNSLIALFGSAKAVLNAFSKEVIPYQDLNVEAVTWLLWQERMADGRD